MSTQYVHCQIKPEGLNAPPPPTLNECAMLVCMWVCWGGKLNLERSRQKLEAGKILFLLKEFLRVSTCSGRRMSTCCGKRVGTCSGRRAGTCGGRRAGTCSGRRTSTCSGRKMSTCSGRRVSTCGRRRAGTCSGRRASTCRGRRVSTCSGSSSGIRDVCSLGCVL